MSSAEYIEMTNAHSAHNYHPLPVVWERAEGVFAYDPEGRRYFDFLAAYSAANQGHCHPKIVGALIEQAKKCDLSSRAFYNTNFALYSKFVTEYFGYEMVLPMNTGAEGVETAMKVSRRWGYVVKGIPDNEAMIVTCENNFHGRTISIITCSTDPDCKKGFGPYTPGMLTIPYDNAEALKEIFEQHGDKICAFMVEPIQGEAGIYIPSDGYLKACYDLCKQYNVLFVADEVQTGLCRTGRLLCVQWENIRPDMVILGKALSGGVYPVSAVLADKSVLGVIKPGEHGSTFGGNSIACSVAVAALEVLRDEKLAERSEVLGEKLRQGLRALNAPFITCIRGRGLMNAVVIDPKFDKSAWDFCLLCASHGLLAKPTHEHIIRLTPPLCITEEQVDECIEIFRKVCHDMVAMKKEDIPMREEHH
eukprot:TRINITY_DN4336_c0_g1_i1.p2 TRINITY_DN4336_c0_g1~~TRINITY_DN4336_c0_g1_i1.p2  ORF type:complete len:420 (-),score=89.08 TRINITY_DN4336_c0_g1_i1:217-1476(-)